MDFSLKVLLCYGIDKKSLKIILLGEFPKGRSKKYEFGFRSLGVILIAVKLRQTRATARSQALPGDEHRSEFAHNLTAMK